MCWPVRESMWGALLPGAEAPSDVRGGTTRQLADYRWRSPAGDVLSITDMPGTAEAGDGLDRLAVDHLVLQELADIGQNGSSDDHVQVDGKRPA